MTQRIWQKPNLEEILFPVKEVHQLNWINEFGRQFPIRGKKAIVNAITNKTLSVVSNQYKLVTNEEALRWAEHKGMPIFISDLESSGLIERYIVYLRKKYNIQDVEENDI